MGFDREGLYLHGIEIQDDSQLATCKNTRVAVAGLGLRGSIFINLVRRGFEKFHIVDPGIDGQKNTNLKSLLGRGAIGRHGDDRLVAEARAVNPDVRIEVFRNGLQPSSVKDFLKGVDWVVDAVDLCALPSKLALNAEARRLGLPVISYATLGCADCMVVFDSGTPSFAELTGMMPEASLPQNVERFFRFITPEVPSSMMEEVVKSLRRPTHVPLIAPDGEISAFAISEIIKNIICLDERVRAPRGVFVDSERKQVRVFEASYRARELPLSKSQVRRAT